MRPMLFVVVAAAFAALGMAGVAAGSHSSQTPRVEPTTIAARTCPEGFRLTKKNKCVQVRGSSGSF